MIKIFKNIFKKLINKKDEKKEEGYNEEYKIYFSSDKNGDCNNVGITEQSKKYSQSQRIRYIKNAKSIKGVFDGFNLNKMKALEQYFVITERDKLVNKTDSIPETAPYYIEFVKWAVSFLEALKGVK